MSQPRNIVSVNTADHGGGAERIAWTLFKGFQRSGNQSWLVVGDKKSDDPGVLPFYLSPHIDYTPYGKWPRAAWIKWLRWFDRRAGREDFNSPYSKYLPTLSGSLPDVIHCHNLHGGYFDLRVLANLSRRLPVFWTLHDCWAFTGHCAYPNGCPRWQSGCGKCPELSLPPAVERDATRANLRRKGTIYAESRLHVATPSRWLMNRVEQSILAPAIVERRVIPNGVDLTLFKPACRQQVREELGIPQAARVVMFAAVKSKTNPYKDYETIRSAVRRVAHRAQSVNLHCLVIGEQAAEESHGNSVIQYIPFQAQGQLAKYYQASDIYLHAAKEDVLPTVIIEAMSCGTPVVATAVGGIPEMIEHQEHGLLVQAGAFEEMAAAIELLLKHDAARQEMGRRAAETARRKFDQQRMISDYLAWYAQILQQNTVNAAA